MTNWLAIKKVAKIMNLSESFIRTVICKEEFQDLCYFGRPILINYNKEFEKLIYKYVKKRNIKHNKRHNETKKKLFNENKNKVINSKLIIKWTQSSIDCYKIGCNCSKCNIKKIINTKCYMKQVVIELVKKFGAPKEIEE